MPTHIEIENGLVSVVNHEVVQTVALADWLPLIERRVPISTPVLPTGTRAVHWDPTNLAQQELVILMEREPFIANLSFSRAVYRVQIPFTRFIFFASTNDPLNTMNWRLNDYRVMWSSHRYSSPDQVDMHTAQLPNVYGDGRICFGTTAPNAHQSLADRLDQTVNEFYISNFNMDLGENFPAAYRSFQAWAADTLANPTAWTQWREWTNPTRGQLKSFNQIVAERMAGQVLRDTLVVAPDPIPPLQIGATFGRLEEWLRAPDMTTAHRQRLLNVLQALRTDEPALFGA